MKHRVLPLMLLLMAFAFAAEANPVQLQDILNEYVEQIEGKGIRRIEVVNAFGQVIFSKETKDDLLQVNLNGHASGVYLLRVVTDDGIMLQQVVKE